MRRSKIISTGRHLPERVVTNAELEKFMDTTHQWIHDRSGIEERRYAEFGVGPSDLGYEAAVIALERAGMEITDIDLIIFATLSPDNGFPGPGCRLNHRLGAKGIATVDVRNQCTGFVYGMAIADQFIKTGMYDHVLVVGGEVHSTGLEFSNRGREVTVLFGDGAGAAILGPSEHEDRGILSTHLHADGKGFKELWVEFPASRRMPREIHQALDDGRQWPRMNGTRVFKNAVVRLPEVIIEGLDANGYVIDDIDHLVPHQANMRINQFVAHKLKIPNEKIWHNIQRYGNTTAATIPICLDEMLEQDVIKDEDLIVIAAFGAGYTWGSVIMRW